MLKILVVKVQQNTVHGGVCKSDSVIQRNYQKELTIFNFQSLEMSTIECRIGEKMQQIHKTEKAKR